MNRVPTKHDVAMDAILERRENPSLQELWSRIEASPDQARLRRAFFAAQQQDDNE